MANDTQPNKLYRNNGDGTFSGRRRSTAGVAFSETGVARAGMGVDAADYDGQRPPEPARRQLLERDDRRSTTTRATACSSTRRPPRRVGRATLLTLAFGCFFFDYDLDGRPDIFAANGHVADDIERVQPQVTYAQAPHLFRNLGERRFDDVTATARARRCTQPVVARGAAYGDFDNDGDLDVLVNVNNGPARLLRNDGGNRSRFLRVKTIGTKSNRDGIGARVTITLAGGRQAVADGAHRLELLLAERHRRSPSASARAQRVESVEVAWPSGQVDRTGPVVANQVAFVQEGSGARVGEAASAEGGAARALTGVPETIIG